MYGELNVDVKCDFDIEVKVTVDFNGLKQSINGPYWAYEMYNNLIGSPVLGIHCTLKIRRSLKRLGPWAYVFDFVV